MAAANESIWAVDIGNSSLKALRLSTERGVLEVVDFDNIRHGKILSGGGVSEAEKEELVAFSLRQFVNKHDLSMDEVVISVPSQNSFARFVNLPPVEPKRVPEIVQFEAVQQIPFDINEVQWDWQRMNEEDSSELKVGIFAIKNEIVNSAIDVLSREDIQVSYVQMAPMALYNYLLYDRPDLVNSDVRATVVLNVGAEITDLVVCTKSSVWQRCILLGGNSFTKAIADTFKLSFEKAEKLKRTAPVSKYARQIFQAMRPVFTELASEVQRSIGFYKSSNPSTKISKVVGMGGGTKLRGLLKYLQQTLQMPVERPDSFKRLTAAPGVPAAKFGENVCDFGVVYGLGLQGLGMAGIESNLLPRSMVRSMAWANKSRWFLGAACILLAVSVMSLGRTLFDRMSHTKKNSIRVQTQKILNDSKRAKQNLFQEDAKIEECKAVIAKEFAPFAYRDIIPSLYETIFSALPNAENNPLQAGLYRAFAQGDVESVMKIPRKQRMQLFITGMSIEFARSLPTAPFSEAGISRDKPTVSAANRGANYEDFTDSPKRKSRIVMRYESRLKGLVDEVAEKEKSGFVVTIAGYSPYESIESLIDPPGAKGFVTRLMELSDSNSPFSLFEKANLKHFNFSVGEVVAGGTDAMQMPDGIGEASVRRSAAGPGARYTSKTEQPILIDPLTKELISKAPKVDANGNTVLDRGRAVYEVNDHWFVLNMKFLWRDAPVLPTLPEEGSEG
ncbi:MAG: type IV pilus assembly protein PilM [Sedimentisphaerales bacterium]|nr:type IV pilus assembly protein PilM [Sedimentisphaerales bacterium]